MQCKTILIVEDDWHIREALQMTLELEGYTVTTAGNGEEVLRMLSVVEKPCLILLDLMMPVMDGWAFAQEIEKDVILAAIPIVVISAFADKAGSVKKASGIIKKPVDIEILLRMVRKYCHEDSEEESR